MKYKTKKLGLACIAPALFAVNAQSTVIEEVIITAQKREQSLQDVSVSVSAFTGDKLKNLGVEKTVDLAAQTPGLNIKNAVGDQNPVISIRGVGLNDFLPTNSPTASVYIDRVVVPSHAMLGFQLMDVSRVEVLKGPQGTLYGRNTTAGAINYVSNPPTEEFEGTVSADFSSYDTVQVEGAVGGRITENIKGRLSLVSRRREEGYQFSRTFNDHHGNQDRLAYRVQLLWEPSETFDMLLNLHGGKENSESPFYEHNGSLVPELAPFDNIGTFCDAALQGRQVSDGSCVDFLGYFDPDDDPHQGDWNRRFGNINQSEAKGAALTMNWELSRGTITSVSGFDNMDRILAEDVDNSPAIGIEDRPEDDISAISQEIIFTSDDSWGIDWIAGAFYAEDEVDAFLTEDLADLDGFVLIRDAKQESTSYALFVHGIYDVSDTLSVKGGLRYTSEDREYRVRIDDMSAGELLFMGENDFSDTDVSGELGVEYGPAEDVLLYATFSKGYKSGNFNASSAVQRIEQLEPTKAEELYALELGVKSTLLDGSMQLNAAAYFYDWKNFQANGTDFVNGLPLRTLITAGDAEIVGLETSVLWHPLDSLTFDFGLNYMDTEVVDGTVDPGTGLRQNQGNQLQNSPELTVNGVITFEQSIGNGLMLTMQTDFSWQDEVFFNVDNNPFHAEDSYTLVNARIAVGSEEGNWEVALWGRNLTNEDYRQEVFDLFDIGSSLFIYGEPRTTGLRLTYNF